MKFKSLWALLDSFHPLWIDADDESEYYENKLDRALCKYSDYVVQYITLDGDGVLTIELVEAKR